MCTAPRRRQPRAQQQRTRSPAGGLALAPRGRAEPAPGAAAQATAAVPRRPRGAGWFRAVFMKRQPLLQSAASRAVTFSPAASFRFRQSQGPHEVPRTESWTRARRPQMPRRPSLRPGRPVRREPARLRPRLPRPLSRSPPRSRPTLPLPSGRGRRPYLSLREPGGHAGTAAGTRRKPAGGARRGRSVAEPLPLVESAGVLRPARRGRAGRGGASSLRLPGAGGAGPLDARHQGGRPRSPGARGCRSPAV